MSRDFHITNATDLYELDLVLVSCDWIAASLNSDHPCYSDDKGFTIRRAKMLYSQAKDLIWAAYPLKDRTRIREARNRCYELRDLIAEHGRDPIFTSELNQLYKNNPELSESWCL